MARGQQYPGTSSARDDLHRKWHVTWCHVTSSLRDCTWIPKWQLVGKNPESTASSALLALLLVLRTPSISLDLERNSFSTGKSYSTVTHCDFMVCSKTVLTNSPGSRKCMAWSGLLGEQPHFPSHSVMCRLDTKAQTKCSQGHFRPK